MKLIDHSIELFVQELASGNATPGGGSAAAAAGAMAAGLCTMVARLTRSGQDDSGNKSWMETVAEKCRGLQEDFIRLVDADAAAYGRVMAAFRLPRDTEGEKAERVAAVQAAFREAAGVPLETLATAAQLSGLLEKAVLQGNRNCLSDAGAAVHLCRTCAHVAGYNVTINLGSIRDRSYVEKSRRAVDELLATVDRVVNRLESAVAAGLDPHGEGEIQS